MILVQGKRGFSSLVVVLVKEIIRVTGHWDSNFEKNGTYI